MKIVDGTFDAAVGAFDGTHGRGRGWSVFVEALSVPARIGIHPHEHGQPQPLVIDAQLGYGRAPKEAGDWIDYESWCARIADFLAHKTHTRLLETLVADMAALSFREWPALETLTLAVHKPKIRPGTRRVGVSLEWTRADYLQWSATAVNT
ncbi:Putative dihydroneopterin aldolase protein [Paraburkholderia tropica]|uniref:dihydroneopterin aldolase n=1 Tax=Paraburkholderia TaxID=1822464 RepID=UPI001CB268DD|nr:MULTISPECIES: dihydroneopterin aldolase [Paraburkholderia]CAG9212675.1 Putative dihydroneopterin aldolase protein [Paraburkholderia tropica]